MGIGARDSGELRGREDEARRPRGPNRGLQRQQGRDKGATFDTGRKNPCQPHHAPRRAHLQRVPVAAPVVHNLDRREGAVVEALETREEGAQERAPRQSTATGV